MEYAAGGTLFDLVDSKAKAGQHLEEEEVTGKLTGYGFKSFLQVAHLFAQIVLAMQYVHQNQILHRDLKSQNIFLARSLENVITGLLNGISVSKRQVDCSRNSAQGLNKKVWLQLKR